MYYPLTASLVIYYLDLEKTEVEYLLSILSTKEKELRKLIDQDNCISSTDTRIQNIYGEEFTFQLRPMGAMKGSCAYKEYQKEFGANVNLKEVYEFSMWDYTGHTALYEKTFVIDKGFIPKNIMKEIIKVSEEYTQGIIHCSDCGEAIEKSKIAGSYFAGIFCEGCWLGTKGSHKNKGGWERVEANESYN